MNKNVSIKLVLYRKLEGMINATIRSMLFDASNDSSSF